MSRAVTQMKFLELSKPLYHGTATAFSSVDLSLSAPKKDFGQGFYTTNDRIQAEKFARLRVRRENAERGFVLVFNLKNTKGLNIKNFAIANEEWFDFVLSKRGYGRLASSCSNDTFDIVIGPVANDAVGLVLNQYVAGTYGDPEDVESKATAVRLLLTQNLHNQVFFGTEKAVLPLAFSEIYNVYID